MTQRRGPVIAWSAGVTAGALAAATLIATVQKNPFADPLMILLTVIGTAALLITVIAGIPDLASWIAGGLRAAIRPARRTRSSKPTVGHTPRTR